jgi:hypothetical protein
MYSRLTLPLYNFLYKCQLFFDRALRRQAFPAFAEAEPSLSGLAEQHFRSEGHRSCRVSHLLAHFHLGNSSARSFINLFPRVVNCHFEIKDSCPRGACRL